MPKPTVARIVHYQAYGTPGGEHPSVPRAAIITEVRPKNPTDPTCFHEEGQYEVALCVLNPTGQFFNPHVPFSAEPKPGCWNWPPRD